MPASVTEAEVLDFLRSIESGEVSLVPLQEPQSVYAGVVEYAASNGWTITVFNDANEWDYIDRMRTADGRECDYDHICERMPQIDTYEPSEEVAWLRYRIPGCMKYRCVRCGQRLERESPIRPFFLCPACSEQPAA
jgi:hypothetical protein